jgi:hypothetical protein
MYFHTSGERQENSHMQLLLYSLAKHSIKVRHSCEVSEVRKRYENI